MLELQALVDAFDAPQPPAASRMRYAFGCEFPYRLALRRELGEQLVSMGLIGAAVLLGRLLAIRVFRHSMTACKWQAYSSLCPRYRHVAAMTCCQLAVSTVLPVHANSHCPRSDSNVHFLTSYDVPQVRTTRRLPEEQGCSSIRPRNDVWNDRLQAARWRFLRSWSYGTTLLPAIACCRRNPRRACGIGARREVVPRVVGAVMLTCVRLPMLGMSQVRLPGTREHRSCRDIV